MIKQSSECVIDDKGTLIYLKVPPKLKRGEMGFQGHKSENINNVCSSITHRCHLLSTSVYSNTGEKRVWKQHYLSELPEKDTASQ